MEICPTENDEEIEWLSTTSRSSHIGWETFVRATRSRRFIFFYNYQIPAGWTRSEPQKRMLRWHGKACRRPRQLTVARIHRVIFFVLELSARGREIKNETYPHDGEVWGGSSATYNILIRSLKVRER